MYAIARTHRDLTEFRDDIGVTDIYAAAGIGRPGLSHLDDAFIARIQEQRHPHLAIEALRRLIEQRCARSPNTTSSSRSPSPSALNELMRKYTNQNLTTAEIIAELVAFAEEVSADANRRASLAPPLTSDELAFYDAVAQNESAVNGMGTGVLANIARDLVRTLRRDGYPPDAGAEAIKRVLDQMETFADDWSPMA